MKTTFDIPEDLLVEAKKAAAEQRRPLRALVTEGLRAQIETRRRRKRGPGGKRPRIRWVTVSGELAPDLEVADREKMTEWVRRHS